MKRLPFGIAIAAVLAALVSYAPELAAQASRAGVPFGFNVAASDDSAVKIGGTFTPVGTATQGLYVNQTLRAQQAGQAVAALRVSPTLAEYVSGAAPAYFASIYATAPTITAGAATNPTIGAALYLGAEGSGATNNFSLYSAGAARFNTTINVANATSGLISLAAPTGALGTPTLTLPTQAGGIATSINCGATGSGNQNCTATAANGLTKTFAGSSTLSGSAAVITFPTAFTSTSTYQCVANDITTRANPVQMVSTSSTTATITNTTGATDVINWICAGQ